MRRLGLIALAAMLALTGCTNPPSPIAADQAVAHYDGLAAELKQALAPLVPAYTSVPMVRVQTSGGGCRYTSGAWEPATPRASILDEPAWPQIKASINTILARYDFPSIDQPERREAFLIFMVTDRHDAHMWLDSNGEVSVASALVAANPCTEAALGLP